MTLADELKPDKPVPDGMKTKIEVDATGATVTNALFNTSTPTFEDWGFIFKRFNLDPEQFEIVDDTVGMSSWDQSSRTPDGDRDLLQSYSFRARFRRLPQGRLGAMDVQQKLEDMRNWKPPKLPVDRRMKPSVSEIILPSDFQSGKPEGGGVDGLTERWHRAMDQIDDKVTKLKREKHLHSLALVNMGDLIEGCFAAETMVPTDKGHRRIDSLAADGHAMVRTDYGAWVDAEFRSFGVQQLRKVTLDRYGAKKVIYATPEHRWLTKRGNNRIDRTTDELQPGMHLAGVFGGKPKGLQASTFGVAHGVVFGDGHLDENSSSARLNLYGVKAELGRYMNGMAPEGPYQRAEGEQSYVSYSRLPRYFKSAPAPEESSAYLMGFLAGYMATDGSVGKTVSISSSRRENLELVEDICFKLGIGANPITSSRRLGKGIEETDIFSISLLRSTVPESLFVREDQRQAFLASNAKSADDQYVGVKARALHWRVESVEITGRIEEVYCAVVPDTHTFVIEGNILTGNCNGFYPDQHFTVQMDLRSQLKYAAEALETFSKHFFPMADNGHFITTLSNHGELGRTNGGNKNTTGDHDSADGLLAEWMQMVLRSNSAFDHVQFHTPHDEMVTYVEIQGVPMGFLHGHKVKGGDAGGFTKWLEAQQRGDRRAWEVEMWHIAHRHNFQMWDIGSASVLQMPSIDGGSKSFRDATGKFARPGMVSYTLNPEIPVKWEDLLLAGQETRMLAA